jgi:hypothetical protein
MGLGTKIAHKECLLGFGNYMTVKMGVLRISIDVG